MRVFFTEPEIGTNHCGQKAGEHACPLVSYGGCLYAYKPGDDQNYIVKLIDNNG
jgi:hypothetical protein